MPIANNGHHGQTRPRVKSEIMANAINWFEIPALDFDRAVEFYSTMLDREVDVMEMDEGKYGVFEVDDGEVGGAITPAGEFQMPDGETMFSAEPGEVGTTIYLAVAGELNDALTTAEESGGEVLVPKQPLEDDGHFAVIRDTEGNRIGLAGA